MTYRYDFPHTENKHKSKTMFEATLKKTKIGKDYLATSNCLDNKYFGQEQGQAATLEQI